MKDLLQIKGRRYLVTGAASGIGRATSLLLSEMGAKVLLVDINEDGLLQVQSECQGETEILVLNLIDSDSIKAAVKEKVTTLGKLNGFVHCAGLPYIAPLKVINS